MNRRILLLLNIKPHESALVRKLFTVQFFLGIATAFYFTSTLSMFLSAYKADSLPVVYMLSAALLFGFNRFYAYYEEKMNSPGLLEFVILFSAAVILVFWLLLTFFDFSKLKLIIAASYLVIYMLVGYAFWGMASIMFNVRESKRLFSIVGAGDIPAKMLGYFSVSALIHVVSLINLLWISICSFVFAFLLMKRYQKQGFILVGETNEPHEHPAHDEKISLTMSIIKRFFYNKLILYIALLSFLSYVAFAFIDFTFLTDIKEKFKKGEQMATFIGIFFAVGRVFAIGIKLLFSSRMIARIGLTNCLLFTPVLLLIINVIIIILGPDFHSHLILFGGMVLLTEVLRSTLQEPVFFILFQPLHPHDRLRGHLVAKGYTMPFALIGVGVFLYLFMKSNVEMPITLVAEILLVFLVLWIVSIFLIKNQYLATLIKSLKKGYFTGAELFLNDTKVTDLLLEKTQSNNAIEVIHSLNLLERSGYKNIYMLLLQFLDNPKIEIKEYVLSRIIENNMSSALPQIKRLIEEKTELINPGLIKAYYFLETNIGKDSLIDINSLPQQEIKPAIVGLLRRHDEEVEAWALKELRKLASGNSQNKMLVLEIITESQGPIFTDILKMLLLDKKPAVYKKAIEVTGKIRDFGLFNEIIEVATRFQAFGALQRSLLFYGDEVFSTEYWEAETIPEPLLTTIIKTAGKIKGEKSTVFLFKLLYRFTTHSDQIIEALWLKKAIGDINNNKILEDWINEKIEQTKIKIIYYNDLETISIFKLLQDAIGSELKYDLQMLLKAFALQYDRQKIDRVIELINLDNKERKYNAIEVLELMIPGKYFTQINNLVELLNDIKEHQVLLPKTHNFNGKNILEDIIKDKKANFNEWTRSVACYMFPNLKKNDFSLNFLHTHPVKGEVLFNETRNYVLSMLK